MSVGAIDSHPSRDKFIYLHHQPTNTFVCWIIKKKERKEKKRNNQFQKSLALTHYRLHTHINTSAMIHASLLLLSLFLLLLCENRRKVKEEEDEPM